MSVINSQPLIGASGQAGYFLDRSLRFRSSASAYLNRTPASAGNRKTFTWSAWVKRGSLTTTNGGLFGARGASGAFNAFQFTSSDTLQTYSYDGSTFAFNFNTTQVFRDPSAWYHIVFAFDTTQATSTNRVKIYVNGSQITAFSTATYPSQNFDTAVNSTIAHFLSVASTSDANYLDGYMTEVNFIDGQALTPSSFGETSASTGVWIPKKYAGTYGTNGFYLDFEDNSALTTSSNAGLGKDNSGNGNYWTTNNISITSGATYDSMTDVPTLTSATAANYAVLNPLDKGGNITLSAANLNYSTGSTNMVRATMQIPNTGKWYWECTQTSANAEQFGIATATANTGTYLGGDANGWSYGGSGNKFNNNTSTAYGASFTNGDVIGVAFDADAGTLTFYKNNSSQGTAFSSLTGSYFPAVGGNISSGVINFGQRPFAYTPPTGFVALNTFNLPTPTIGATASSQANKYFDIATYNNATVVSGLGFAPDMVWHKSRNQTYNHYVYDKVRGTGAKGLNTNNTGAEGSTDALGIVSFDSAGVTYSSDAGLSQTNAVGWFWRANGSGSSNTAGSITSTVSANTTAGFSIVTYTGNGTNGATVGHGLGVAPRMIIIKNRSTVVNWPVWHASIPSNQLYLNLTNAVDSPADISSVGSSTFALSTWAGANGNGNNMVAYCFAEVAGYSQFGLYTGNGSSDGTFVFTGFRPSFVMLKRTDSTGNWNMYDDSRSPTNAAEKILYANLNGAEDSWPSGTGIDILSNGFKLRRAESDHNASGGTFIYMAFAESPFKYSVAR